MKNKILFGLLLVLILFFIIIIVLIGYFKKNEVEEIKENDNDIVKEQIIDLDEKYEDYLDITSDEMKKRKNV